MKFFDYAIIYVQAGKGGDGCISFHRARFIPKGGPDGGNGGNGGSIYITADHNINDLRNFYYKNNYIAKNGFPGKNKQRTGKNGKDLILKVPLGTKIIDFKTNVILSCLDKHNQKFLIVKGGKNGLGNINFKSSINRTPYKKTKGILGQKKKIKLELILKVNIGVLGLPNTGKSTLINVLSSSKNKISYYPFTTKKPILNIIQNKLNNSNISILDVPGIFKDSFLNKGLGLSFIKHFKYCNLIFYIIDISLIYKKDDVFNIIDTINNEIIKYDKTLLFKEQWIILNKIDLLKDLKSLTFYIKKKIIQYKYITKFYFVSSKNNINIKKLYMDILYYFYKLKN
ncbi:GTPase ObgE [Enterobacteriaceae endosymbiont of Donacia provostii]|uniref:Obg family GTPase CgtA n=1 Tax=Enterobacteriaceae endosymbiont of Donacia provostii TaxID=2675781 RepID=UPI001448C669|nr:GTPase ObgE [Enterobacteriaceae endosymbiont of Donacia provostii]QJC33902.1 GTPase ObgE [Enterobacteriaceae endosymbiont of Donacia provostii]